MDLSLPNNYFESRFGMNTQIVIATMYHDTTLYYLLNHFISIVFVYLSLNFQFWWSQAFQHPGKSDCFVIR
jgi:hypothetical protein